VGAFVHQGDLADGALVRRVLREHRIKAVMHFAAYAYVGESMHEPGKYFENNFCNSVTLLEAMRAEGVNVSGVLLDLRDVRQSADAADRRGPSTAPVNPYGESKLFVERMLARFGAAHGLRYAALRYFNAAGADADGELGEDHDPETHLIPLIIGAGLRRRPHVSIFGTDYPTPDGTAVRDYVHVTDLASAHVSALRRLQGWQRMPAAQPGHGPGPFGASR
jgi:UDP-glucose 4-epimerase